MLTKKIISLLLIIMISIAILDNQSHGANNLKLHSNGLWVIEKIDGQIPLFETGQAIRFHKNGKLSVYVDCNQTVADYIINQSKKTIRVTNMISTEKSCGGGMQPDSSITGMIMGIRRYQIYGNRLILITNNGQKLSFLFKADKN